MSVQLEIKNSTLRLIKVDITDFEIESFVYYAQHDLVLGSGFGGAITVRGGPSIQEELKEHGTLKTTEAVISSAGNMKAQHIIHSVGPRFREENLEEKLKTSILNVLKLAEEKGITAIAFPPMGTGFYGVPLDTSAEITVNTLREYLEGDTKIKDVAICVNDSREYQPFEKKFAQFSKA